MEEGEVERRAREREKGDGGGGGGVGGRKIRRDQWNCAGWGGDSGAFAFSSQWLPYKTASEAKVIK